MRYPDDEKLISVCPDEESISNLAEGKLSIYQREALLRHIAVCKTCSAEFFLLRKSKSERTTIRKNSARNRNVFQFLAAAAIIALVIGFAGHNVLDRFTGNSKAPMEQMVSKDDLYESNITAPAPAPAPETAKESASMADYRGNSRAKSSRIMPKRITAEQDLAKSEPYDGNISDMSAGVTADTQDEILDSEILEAPVIAQDTVIEVHEAQGIQVVQEKKKAVTQEAPPIFSVIYNGCDGDKADVIRLIKLITETDESNAEVIAGSNSFILKECASMEEAQKIKKELESAGAKIEIIEKQ
jgi:ribosomal protein L7/L12